MPASERVAVPPLVDGEQLTSEEFLQRWEALPELKCAELLEGVVFLPSPVTDRHGIRTRLLGYWLSTYEWATPGCRGSDNATWLMGARNTTQPDVTLRLLPEYVGQSRLEGDYTAGAPEFAGEVTVSQTAGKLAVKQRIYAALGVRELLVWTSRPERVTWLRLEEGQYVELLPDSDGLLRSGVFPGLWLDVAALSAEDGHQLVAAVQRGVQSTEHGAFVDALARRRAEYSS